MNHKYWDYVGQYLGSNKEKDINKINKEKLMCDLIGFLSRLN